MSQLEIIKFKVKSVLDLIKMNLRVIVREVGYLNYMNGKLFTLGEAGNSIIVFYAEAEKKGDFIQYNMSTNDWKWTSRMETPTPLIKYIPIVDIEASSIDLF